MTNTDTEALNKAALQLFTQYGLSLWEAAMLIRHLYRNLPGKGSKLARAEKCIQLGKQELARQEKTVTFATAVQETLEAKRNKRQRTLVEIKYICNRLMGRCPKLAQRRVRSIRPEECRAWIETAFSTPRQQYKARLIMSGVFTIACRRGWCSTNPASSKALDIPPPVEHPVSILSISEVERLKATAQRLYGGSCCAALGLMLYAGIRPAEVTRLTWDTIDFDEDVITLHPIHTKTGGSRHVSILPILRQWLLPCKPPQQKHNSHPICPANWTTKWKHIRNIAGWGLGGLPWVQDVLRHTFASYHLKRFHNLSELQYEMGHNHPHLLRKRYLNMAGLTNQAAKRFWGESSSPSFT